MTTIALVRHGQTNLNVQGRWQGSTDEPLNDVGRRQIYSSAPVLAIAGTWSTIVSSPLARAQETANIISTSLGIPAPTFDSRLVEQHGGEAEALLESEVRARWPHEEDIPGAETRIEVSARGSAALREIAATHRGQSVVVVAHGTFIRLSLGELTRKKAPPLLPNGGFTIASVDADEGRWTVDTASSPRLP